MRPVSWADTLSSQQLQVERKRFLVALKENPAGRFLRVTELMGDRSNTIIIPASGLREFSKLLGEMLAAADMPSSHPAVPPLAPESTAGEEHLAEASVSAPA